MTLAGWLAVLRPRLTEPLFSGPAVQRLLEAAQHLPADGLAVLEVRLVQEAGPVDLSVKIATPDQARAAAACPLPPHLWDLLSLWAELGGPFAQVPCVWLEFDLEVDGAGLPMPSICARLPDPVDTDWLLGSLWPALHGRPLALPQRELAHRCLEVLPSSASLLYVFSLLSRPGGAIRMEVFVRDVAGLLESLRRISPTAVPALEPVLPCFEAAERLHLSFDITSEVQPRIGIEGSFPWPPSREPRWADLLRRLVERGWCTPEKADAVLGWPGHDSFWTAAERWPETAGPRTVLVRSLSHLKVVCAPGREPEAKAYLAFGSLDRSGAGAAASPEASSSDLAT